jgi:hypothetical protein
VVATLTGQVTEKDRQIRKLAEIIDSLGLALRERAAR